MVAATSRETRSALMAATIWRHPALSLVWRSCRRPTGNALARPFRHPCKRKSRPGRSDGRELTGQFTTTKERPLMNLATTTKTFDCAIDDGLAHIVLNQPDRGNPIDGEFCREFNLSIAELSERAD